MSDPSKDKMFLYFMNGFHFTDITLFQIPMLSVMEGGWSQERCDGTKEKPTRLLWQNGKTADTSTPMRSNLRHYSIKEVRVEFRRIHKI